MHSFLDKATRMSKFGKGESNFSDEESQEYLRLKSEKFHHQGQFSLAPSVSTACISQLVEG